MRFQRRITPLRRGMQFSEQLKEVDCEGMGLK